MAPGEDEGAFRLLPAGRGDHAAALRIREAEQVRPVSGQAMEDEEGGGELVRGAAFPFRCDADCGRI